MTAFSGSITGRSTPIATGPLTGVQGDKGALAPKQGSILYDGLAGLGKTSKPYDKLFTDQDEWLKRPVEQPPRLDPETDEWFRR
ncbi:MAG: hypothetical protein R3C60_14570 [Parvularculaceae bacterium]